MVRQMSVINQIRGLLLERGITIRQGRRHAEASLPGILEDPEQPQEQTTKRLDLLCLERSSKYKASVAVYISICSNSIALAV